MGVRVSPHYQAAKMGDNVLFTCWSDKTTAWNFNKGKLPENVQHIRDQENKTILHINNVQLKNTGVYTCYVVDDIHTSIDDSGNEDDGVLTVGGKIL